MKLIINSKKLQTSVVIDHYFRNNDHGPNDDFTGNES